MEIVLVFCKHDCNKCKIWHMYASFKTKCKTKTLISAPISWVQFLELWQLACCGCSLVIMPLTSSTWLFSFVSTFPTSMIKPIRWLKFFCRQKAGWGCWGWGGARIIRFCSISVSLRTRALKSECLAGLCYLLARWLWEISQPFEPQLSMNGNGGKEALTSQISLRIKWDCVCQNT